MHNPVASFAVTTAAATATRCSARPAPFPQRRSCSQAHNWSAAVTPGRNPFVALAPAPDRTRNRTLRAISSLSSRRQPRALACTAPHHIVTKHRAIQHWERRAAAGVGVHQQGHVPHWRGDCGVAGVCAGAALHPGLGDTGECGDGAGAVPPRAAGAPHTSAGSINRHPRRRRALRNVAGRHGGGGGARGGGVPAPVLPEPGHVRSAARRARVPLRPRCRMHPSTLAPLTPPQSPWRGGSCLTSWWPAPRSAWLKHCSGRCPCASCQPTPSRCPTASKHTPLRCSLYWAHRSTQNDTTPHRPNPLCNAIVICC